MGCRVEEKSLGSRGPTYEDIHLSGASSFIAIKECKFPISMINPINLNFRFVSVFH